jgi:hypothetical protein
MPMWNVFCAVPWGWFGWIMLSIGLLFIGMMAVLCFRSMGGCMAGFCHIASGENEGLRKEILELQQQIRKLNERS